MTLPNRKPLLSKKSDPGKRYAFLVGVSIFQDSHFHPITLVKRDVSELGKTLDESQSFDGIRILIDEQATRQRILEDLDTVIHKLERNDLLFLYFSTHGVRRKDSSYLLTYDSGVNASDRKAPPENAITSTDIFNRIPSLQSVLFITDSCHQDGPGTDGFAFSVVLPENIVGLQSSRPNEVSIESTELNHGVFTYYLIQGLRGEANRGRSNEVSIFDLHHYVSRKTQDYTHGRQTPVLTYRGVEDFLITKHPPTEKQINARRKKEIENELISDMEAYWRSERWADVLDRWDDLLECTMSNNAQGLNMALQARFRLDEVSRAKFDTDPIEISTLSKYPQIWPCQLDRRVGHPDAILTHRDAEKGDILLGLQFIRNKIPALVSIYLAETNSFPAVFELSEAENDSPPAENEPNKRIAYYVIAKKILDLSEKPIDLQADPEVFSALPWLDFLTDKQPLRALSSDLRALGLWDRIRAIILRRLPENAQRLFELELSPLRAVATNESNRPVLRTLGDALKSSYLSHLGGWGGSTTGRVLGSLLDTYLNSAAPSVEHSDPGPDVTQVKPAASAAAAPVPPSIAKADGASVARATTAATAAPTPSAPAPSRVVDPVPDPDELTLRIKGNLRTLSMAGKELWRTEDPSLNWKQPLFANGTDEAKLLTLSDAKVELPDWERGPTENFGAQLSALVFGTPIPDVVVQAFAVDSGSKRRLVLDLDGDAAEAPLEYLHIGTGFILERRISIVRQVDTVVRPHSLKLQPPPTVLAFAYADPKNETVNINEHRDRIERTLRSSEISLRPYSFCTTDDICKALLKSRVDGFHFLGHGERDAEKRPYLVVYGDKDVSARLYAEELKRWLGMSQVRFVFFGACHSGSVAPGFAGLAEGIVQATGIPVVAMQLAVPQDFSTNFAAKFYERLQSCGFDLESAVYETRQFLYADKHAFGIPVLFADTRKDPRPVPEISQPPGKAWAQFATVQDRGLASGSSATTEPADKPLAEVTTLHSKVEMRVSPSIPSALRSDPALAPLPRLDHARVEPVDDLTLNIDWSAAQTAFEELRCQYSVPADLLPRIAIELDAGRHVILTGPVGTGKTSLASAIVEALGYRPYVVTASADWTPFEVIGGFFPQAVKDGTAHRLDYAFRPGVFVDAVRGNWEERTGTDDKARRWHRKRDPGALGHWLVLDELNRADMDRALGGLFTALESRRLRLPIAVVEPGSSASIEIPIPKDFRIIATMNGIDRHYLFRLSDALKRRFAFVEVPVTEQPADEWKKICRRFEIKPTELPADEQHLYHVLRRFTYLVRTFHPLGTAHLLAAVHFLVKSRRAGLTTDTRLYQALAGSILPALEEAPRELLHLLVLWAETRDVGKLVSLILRTPTLLYGQRADSGGDKQRLSPMLRRSIAQLEDLNHEELLGATERPPARADEATESLLRSFCHRILRIGETEELTSIAEHLTAMVTA